MKMFAVFDKDGKQVSGAFEYERDAWCDFSFNKKYQSIESIKIFNDAGITCQPVVVLREEVYNEAARAIEGGTGKHCDQLKLMQFLKAGE